MARESALLTKYAPGNLCNLRTFEWFADGAAGRTAGRSAAGAALGGWKWRTNFAMRLPNAAAPSEGSPRTVTGAESGRTGANFAPKTANICPLHRKSPS
jgi:hypothetical protein